MRDDARGADLFQQVLDAARALGVTDVEAIFTTQVEALTRFANNTIHQNVAERASSLNIRPVIDGRTARASTNRFDAASIRAAVEEAVAITRLTEPDPELLPLAEPSAFEPSARFFALTAEATPQHRADAVAESIALVEAQGQTAAGAYSTGEVEFSLFNSRGVRATQRETMAKFSITAMAADSSGWAKASACDHRAMSPRALAESAARKAVLSANPRELAPGRYTVILEPAAVLDLVGQMFMDFSGTSIRDGRSFLNDRIGEKLFGDNINIYDDVHHPEQSGTPFDAEGVPRKRLTLVERGEIREIAYSRHAAAQAGAEPTGHGFPLPNEMGEAPINIVIAGGNTSVDQMIAAADRAILVTRLWYIREVDPYEKIFTGMTRDGTFLVEGGKIVAGVRNFRFNQGLIEMLSNVEQMSPCVRASGEETFDMVVPAMRVGGFNFTEVTRF
jgi:predicted Zn-dependent protease